VALKQKPSTLHQDNRKNALRAYQEVVKPHLSQDEEHERINPLEKDLFLKRLPAECR
jgi:hypothetical protein